MTINKSTKNIIIAGRGNFAESLLKNCNKLAGFKNINILSWHDYNINKLEMSLIIHTGSGRELEKIIEFCNGTQSVLVQAATGLELEKYLKNNLDFVLIKAPNLALPIIKFMKILELTGDMFDSKDFNIKISESHQGSKKTVPGTAVQFANALGLPEENILSIRDESKQKELGIEEQYLDGHAVHWIEINGLGARLSFKTEILGRDAYAYGVLKLFEKFDEISKLEKVNQKIYNITDLVQLRLI